MSGVLPELAHWFGIMPWQVDDLRPDERERLISRLAALPPIGGSIAYTRG